MRIIDIGSEGTGLETVTYGSTAIQLHGHLDDQEVAGLLRGANLLALLPMEIEGCEAWEDFLASHTWKLRHSGFVLWRQPLAELLWL